MSEWIKCDKCNKITQADSCGEKRYKIGVDGFDGYSTFHVCEWCLRSFYLDYLGWVWNDNEGQYKPQESECGMISDKLTTDDGEPDGTGGQIFCP